MLGAACAADDGRERSLLLHHRRHRLRRLLRLLPLPHPLSLRRRPHPYDPLLQASALLYFCVLFAYL